MDAVQPQGSPALHKFAGRVAEYLFHAVTHIQELPVRVRRPDDVWDIGDERTVLPFAGAQGLLRLFAMSDVLNDCLELQRLASFPKEAAHAVLLPYHQTVDPSYPVVEGPCPRSNRSSPSTVDPSYPVVEGDDRLLRGQGLKPAQGDREILHRQVLQEISSQQIFSGLAVKLAVGSVGEGEGPVGLEPADQIGLDRKSTRLNSSHLGISYA